MDPFVWVILFIGIVLGGLSFLAIKCGSGAAGGGPGNLPHEISDLGDSDQGSCDGPE